VKESRAAFIIFLRNVERDVSVWNLKRTQINEYEVTAGRTCYECSNIQYRDIKEHCEIPREGIPFSPTDKEVRRTTPRKPTKRNVLLEIAKYFSAIRRLLKFQSRKIAFLII